MLSRQLEKLKFFHRLSDITNIMSSFQVFYFHNDGKPGPKHVAAFALIVKSQKTLLNQVQPSPIAHQSAKYLANKALYTRLTMKVKKRFNILKRKR